MPVRDQVGEFKALNIAYIGLGVMGSPMARHLAAAGHQLRVFNRSLDKAKLWQRQHGGTLCTSPAEAARGVDVLITCVGNDDDLRQVCLGVQEVDSGTEKQIDEKQSAEQQTADLAGAYAQMPAGSLHIDHTTSSALLARELYAAAKNKQISFVDAPVSGGQAGAENAVLSIMCGGDEAAYQRAVEVFSVYAASHGLMGAAGNGQLSKMVNQVCSAGVLQSLAEGLKLGEAAGLDMRRVLEVISHGAASSWYMKNRGDSMLQREFDFGFAVDWMRKDLAIVLEQAEALHLELPITQRINGYYDEISRAGGGRLDTSALIARLDDD